MGAVAALMPMLGRAATNIILSGGGTQPSAARLHSVTAPWQAQLIAGLFIAVGLMYVFWPRVGWWLKVGWQFREAPEPSGLWLFFARFGGLLIVLAASLVLCAMNGINFRLPISK